MVGPAKEGGGQYQSRDRRPQLAGITNCWHRGNCSGEGGRAGVVVLYEQRSAALPCEGMFSDSSNMCRAPVPL